MQRLLVNLVNYHQRSCDNQLAAGLGFIFTTQTWDYPSFVAAAEWLKSLWRNVNEYHHAKNSPQHWDLLILTRTGFFQLIHFATLSISTQLNQSPESNTKYSQQVEVQEGNLLRNHPCPHSDRSSMKIIVTWNSNGAWFIIVVILTQRGSPVLANPTAALNLP